MSDKQTPRGFIEKYASISDMDTSQVISLLDIQDRQDTKYSRVKTCEKLWNAATKATRAEYDDKIKAMQAEIDKLNRISNKWAQRADNLAEELNQRGEDEPKI